MKRSLARLATVIAVGLVMEASAVAAEPEVGDTLADGQQLAALGRWEDARRAFAAAWARERSPAIAAALGHAELQLGLPVRAAEHLSLALESMSDADRGRPEVFVDLVEARRLVGTLRISTRPGATVSLDGKAVGLAPLERPLFVDAGRHAIHVELAGFVPVERSVEAHMGDDIRTDVGLAQVAPKPLVPRAAEPAQAPTSSGKNPWLIGAGAVAGTATLAVGIGYGISPRSPATTRSITTTSTPASSPRSAARSSPRRSPMRSGRRERLRREPASPPRLSSSTTAAASPSTARSELSVVSAKAGDPRRSPRPIAAAERRDRAAANPFRRTRRGGASRRRPGFGGGRRRRPRSRRW